MLNARRHFHVTSSIQISIRDDGVTLASATVLGDAGSPSFSTRLSAIEAHRLVSGLNRALVLIGEEHRKTVGTEHAGQGARAGETAVDEESVVGHCDDELAYVSNTQTPLRNSNGEETNYLSTAIDTACNKQAGVKAEFLAHRCPLTGLPNLPLLRDWFEQARLLADERAEKFAFVLLDLDNFTAIDHIFDRTTSDTVLRVVAHLLSTCIRGSGAVGRHGSDKFLMLFGGLSDVSLLSSLLHDMQSAVSKRISIDREDVNISATVGVSLYPDDGASFETLLKRANVAMGWARGDGRRSCRFFDRDIDKEATASFRMERDLHKAIEHGQFELYYQPQIEIDSGKIRGIEALLRWRDPERGLVAPGEFMQIAERSRLIVPIGEWVVRECCRQGAAWRRQGLDPMRIAFNVSAVQFAHGGIEEPVLRALNESGFDPEYLEMEITESALIRNVEEARLTLRRLKRIGLQVAVDDFGMGYSNLAYLKRFEVDKLKIDQSLVREMSSNADNQSIIRAIIDMAHALKLDAIGEGVEDEATFNCLRRLNCNEAQGYLFAKPMQADQVPAFIQERNGCLPRWNVQ